MARVIQGGRSTPVEVVFIGERINVWKLLDKYSIHYMDKRISIAEPELSELRSDIEFMQAKALEDKWVGIITHFINSI